MFPVIVQWPVTIYSFGVCAFLALFFGSYLMWHVTRLTTHREEDVFDVLIVSFILALIGGRLVFVLTHLSYFMKLPPLAPFAFHVHPGFHEVTTILLYILSILLVSRLKKLPGDEIIAHVGPGIVLTAAILKIGSFIAGTTVGTLTAFPVRIKYAGFEGLRHMTGLYEGIALLLGCWMTYKVLLWLRHHKTSYPLMVGVLLWIFGFLQIAFEPIKEQGGVFVRHTYMRYFDYGMIGLILLTGLITVLYHLRRHVRRRH